MAEDILSTDLNATPVDKVKTSKPLTPKKSNVAPQQSIEDRTSSVVGLYKEMTDRPRKDYEAAITAEGELSALQKSDEAERESKRIKKQSENLGAYQQTIKNLPERQELKSLEDKLGQPFAPTQDNFQDLATMFSLVGVLGFAIGAGGKGNSIAAMNAMNGMMEGHQQGRQDKYQREKAIFDENTKALKTKIDVLNKRMDEISKLAQTDMEKANMDADVLFAQQGADFLKQYKDKFGLVSTIKLLREKLDGSKELFDIIEKEQFRAQEKAADRDFRLQLARMQSDTRALIAGMKQDGKVGLKPGAKIQEGYVADYQLKADLSAMKEQLKDPELQSMIKAKRIEGFLQEESKVLDQILASEIPPKLQRFLTTVKDVRNNYFLNISGKAVTGGEALRSYGVVPQAGDSPDRMISKIEGMEDRVSQKIAYNRTLYPALPDMSSVVRPGLRTPLIAGQDYTIAADARDAATGGDLRQQASAAFGAYEPDKYDYGINPATGQFARKKKVQ
jgi:hypothetical protein